MNEVTLERAQATDLIGLLAVTESAGWPHTAEDWRTLLRVGEVFAHRSAAGEIVATTALVPYGPALAAINMVIVKPDWRGRGLARALMQRCLTAAGPTATVLISTPYGLPLYQRLGFQTAARICRVTLSGPWRPPVPSPGPGLTVAPLADADVAAVEALDAGVIGADRSRLLRAWLARTSRASVLRRSDGVVVGFTLAVAQGERLLVGPVIAPDAGAATALIVDVTAGHAGPVRLDVQLDQTALVERLAALGCEAADEAPVMVHGADGLPGDRSRLFAVMSRAYC